MDRTWVPFTFEAHELEQLLKDASSCVILKKCKRHIAIGPSALGDVSLAVEESLNCLLSKFVPELGGIVLGYRGVKNSAGAADILNDDPHVHFDIKAEFYVFKPEVGCTLTGVVKKKSKSHIGCLVHKLFNVAIPLPATDERGDISVTSGQQVTFKVEVVDLSDTLPYIKGSFISVRDRPVCPNSSDVSADFSSKKKKRKRNLYEEYENDEVQFKAGDDLVSAKDCPDGKIVSKLPTSILKKIGSPVIRSPNKRISFCNDLPCSDQETNSASGEGIEENKKKRKKSSLITGVHENEPGDLQIKRERKHSKSSEKKNKQNHHVKVEYEETIEEEPRKEKKKKKKKEKFSGEEKGGGMEEGDVVGENAYPELSNSEFQIKINKDSSEKSDKEESSLKTEKKEKGKASKKKRDSHLKTKETKKKEGSGDDLSPENFVSSDEKEIVQQVDKKRKVEISHFNINVPEKSAVTMDRMEDDDETSDKRKKKRKKDRNQISLLPVANSTAVNGLSPDRVKSHPHLFDCFSPIQRSVCEEEQHGFITSIQKENQMSPVKKLKKSVEKIPPIVSEEKKAPSSPKLYKQMVKDTKPTAKQKSKADVIKSKPESDALRDLLLKKAMGKIAGKPLQKSISDSDTSSSDPPDDHSFPKFKKSLEKEKDAASHSDSSSSTQSNLTSKQVEETPLKKVGKAKHKRKPVQKSASFKAGVSDSSSSECDFSQSGLSNQNIVNGTATDNSKFKIEEESDGNGAASDVLPSVIHQKMSPGILESKSQKKGILNLNTKKGTVDNDSLSLMKENLMKKKLELLDSGKSAQSNKKENKKDVAKSTGKIKSKTKHSEKSKNNRTNASSAFPCADELLKNFQRKITDKCK